MKQFNNENGFTLVELLATTFIIILLSGLIFTNYRQSGQQFVLQRSAHKLAQDIRRAQQMAMSAKEYEGSVPPGYGVYFDVGWNIKKYRLYADTNGDNGFFTPPDTVVETIDLEREIIIKEISLPPTTYSSVSINFQPPDPLINIKYNTGPPGQTEVLIILSLENDQNKTKTIRVNKAGLIGVD